MALGRTALFYRKNPKSRLKKILYDKWFQKKRKQVEKRVAANGHNRKNPNSKKGDGNDASHKGGKIVGFEKESENRGRKEKSRKKGSKRDKWKKMKSFMRKKK